MVDGRLFRLFTGSLWPHASLTALPVHSWLWLRVQILHGPSACTGFYLPLWPDRWVWRDGQSGTEVRSECRTWWRELKKREGGREWSEYLQLTDLRKWITCPRQCWGTGREREWTAWRERDFNTVFRHVFRPWRSARHSSVQSIVLHQRVNRWATHLSAQCSTWAWSWYDSLQNGSESSKHAKYLILYYILPSLASWIIPVFSTVG